VETLLPHSALLRLEGTEKRGFLHISQYSTGFLAATLDELLHAGDVLTVEVTAYDSEHDRYEVSRKAMLLNQPLWNWGVRYGETVVGTVVEANETQATLHLEAGITAFMRKEKTDWGAYQILFAAGKLRAGMKVKAVVRHVDRTQRGVLVRPFVGDPKHFREGEVAVARVILTREHMVSGPRLHRVVYGMLESGEIVHCYVNRQETFTSEYPIDKMVTVCIKRFLSYQWILHAVIRDAPTTPAV
jgi:ribosomal protein S1